VAGWLVERSEASGAAMAMLLLDDAKEYLYIRMYNQSSFRVCW
jgi:hypothetical protein